MPEGSPCCALFRITGDMPAGGPHRGNKSNKLGSAWGEMFLPVEGLVAYVLAYCSFAMWTWLSYSIQSSWLSFDLQKKTGTESYDFGKHWVYYFSGDHLSYPCCGATAPIVLGILYIFPRLVSAGESSRQSAAPMYSVDLFILVHIGELEARLTRSRIICTYTGYCISGGIFDLAASGTIPPNAHPAFLAQKEPVAVCLGISTQVPSLHCFEAKASRHTAAPNTILAIISVGLRPDMLARASSPMGDVAMIMLLVIDPTVIKKMATSWY